MRTAKGFVTSDPAQRSSMRPEAIFDADGVVRAWLLPDRIVGRRGSTQAWVDAGVVYSRAGTPIGFLTDGVFRGTDGAITGYLSGRLDPACSPPRQSAPPEPPDIDSADRPDLRTPFSRRRAARNEWSTLTWSGFLLPRALHPRSVTAPAAAAS
jgi:hypothetical protein